MDTLGPEQGFVSCGDRYAGVDIDAIKGLDDALDRIDTKLHTDENEKTVYTTGELFEVFVRTAVDNLDILVPVTDETTQKVA